MGVAREERSGEFELELGVDEVGRAVGSFRAGRGIDRSEAEPTGAEDGGGGAGLLPMDEEAEGIEEEDEVADLVGIAVNRATAPGLPNEVVESTSSYGSDSRDAVSSSFSETIAMESVDKDTEWKDDTEDAGAWFDKDDDEVVLAGSGGASDPPKPTFTLTQSSSLEFGLVFDSDGSLEFDMFEFLDGLDALLFSEWDSNAFIRERTEDPKIKSESSSAMDDEGEDSRMGHPRAGTPEAPHQALGPEGNFDWYNLDQNSLGSANLYTFLTVCSPYGSVTAWTHQLFLFKPDESHAFFNLSRNFSLQIS
ncbi:hypothetical protein BT96DRAFT_974565 [Gymnopus androsaceus JB14]|uniref:Uncharacterized protein n=1 Tax=Gymnopus androsaceus JB14 TaxID=1447944 RepID=A0A6A4HX98_9AGAR|nr:hypothetical protein BT96DRAFT_974565 [Gymnopus androsaceus JB14]